MIFTELPPTQYFAFSTNTGAQSFAESPKQGCKWKLFGGGSRAKRSRELIKHCTWVVEQSLLSRYIWDHKLRQKYIKCAYKVAVDIGCGSLNPYLSLHLYPFGLFRDEGTSVTLQIKVNIPDDCPPIPVTANFSLLWDICMRETTKGKLLAGSKKPTKIPFDKGMVYTHKFFPHSIIKQCSCEAFEIHIYTSYLCQEVHTASDAVVPESVRGTPKHVLPGKLYKLEPLNTADIGTDRYRVVVPFQRQKCNTTIIGLSKSLYSECPLSEVPLYVLSISYNSRLLYIYFQGIFPPCRSCCISRWPVVRF